MKEKTADEMFEELGYEKLVQDDADEIFYEKGVSLKCRIIFKKENKTVCCIFIDDDYDWNESLEINMQELQAINKKCQELGWI